MKGAFAGGGTSLLILCSREFLFALVTSKGNASAASAAILCNRCRFNLRAEQAVCFWKKKDIIKHLTRQWASESCYHESFPSSTWICSWQEQPTLMDWGCDPAVMDFYCLENLSLKPTRWLQFCSSSSHLCQGSWVARNWNQILPVLDVPSSPTLLLLKLGMMLEINH